MMRFGSVGVPALALVALAGCSSMRGAAPVVDRSVGAPTVAPRPAASAPVPAKEAAPTAPVAPAAVVAETSTRQAGSYIVKPGDTLIRIGLETGQNWRDIARWNAIENANLIEVGQVLRVVPPGVDVGVATSRPVANTRAEGRPLEARAPTTAAVPAGLPPAASAPAATSRDGDEDVAWSWPAQGSLAGGFDEGRSKGVAILGKAGDPVLAAADGRVVYAGSGLRGYGNLIIVKHNATYLTAYAHNQSLLVKEDQAVRRGQKIAEMGSSDAERVQLHFEIRRQGKPVDPVKLLPAR